MAGQATTASCPECAAGLAHCHGALIAHPDGALECTEGSCADCSPESHALRGDCFDLLAECACTVAEPVPLRRAS